MSQERTQIPPSAGVEGHESVPHPVSVNAEGIELDASPRRPRSDERPDAAALKLTPWARRDDGDALLIWRDRVSGNGTHDLPNSIRHTHHVYCGEQ